MIDINEPVGVPPVMEVESEHWLFTLDIRYKSYLMRQIGMGRDVAWWKKIHHREDWKLH